MNKIVFALILAVLSMGCSDTFVIVYPELDAGVGTDGSLPLPLVDTGKDTAEVLPDATEALPDAAVADAAAEAAVPDTCARHPECCPNGQPANVYAACYLPGVPAASAMPYCNEAGACVPTFRQTCNIESRCCDGWRAREIPGPDLCNCVPSYDYAGGGNWGCTLASELQVPGGAGNGQGTCETLPSGTPACVTQVH